MLPRHDLSALPERYRAFHADLSSVLGEDRLACDPLRTLAFGTDASLYRLIPKIVVLVRSAAEVADVLRAAARHGVGCTFRTAGTSLSGQAVTDSVLVQLAGGFCGATVRDGGLAITVEPGVIGAEANQLLARHGRRLGPDPTSIDSAMMGGIAANNASGMRCRTSANAYHTVQGMKLVFADGAELDTADPASRAAFARTHAPLLEGLAALRDEIAADEPLARRIREKYRIQNTTGYGLNSFVDHHDPFDILLHLMIGSEGTLAFMSEITFRTVEDHAYKASALVLYRSLEHAALAGQRLKEAPISAAELMDRSSLRAVEDRPGLPPMLKELPREACALLVQVIAPSRGALERETEIVAALLSGIPTLAPVAFTSDRAACDPLWDARKWLFTAVGAGRKPGTSVVIEDVAFPAQHLAAGTMELERLFVEHGYQDGLLFGHAIDANVHFVFTQDFNDPAEVERYRRFMEEVCQTVVRKHGGSLKAEHGTGRNMAPFVELEWGEKAYAVMKRVKALFDPRGILNPGVILNEDRGAFVKHLKPLPLAHPIVDACTECGACEPKCASRALTLSPRQRITAQREIARLRASNEAPERLARLVEDYRYLGLDTCAVDGLCATACPVAIDTGKLTKALRAEGRRGLARGVANAIGAHYGGALRLARAAFGVTDAAHALLGDRFMTRVSGGLRRMSGRLVPAWNRHVPAPARTGPLRDLVKGRPLRVVYFPACVTRLWGPSRSGTDERAVSAAVLSILDKAGYDVLFPGRLGSLCCGLCFESKGFPELADRKCRELELELSARSEHGAVPVLCDTSPCVQRMRARFEPGTRVYEPAEFIHAHLMDRLKFERRAGTIAVHVTCAATRMGLGAKLKAVAQACAEKVMVSHVGCCAFAGDRGLTTPELNASALRGLREAIKGCEAGYSSSRPCEIGLSEHGGIPFSSIAYLVDRCTSAVEPSAVVGPATPAAESA